MQIEMLQKLRNSLPHGWQKRATEETGLSRSTLSAMVNGKQTMNLDVAQYLVQMADEYKASQKAVEREIKKL